MQVAIIGAGGIGGHLAVRLGLAGHAVSVLARGRHLAAIRGAGLRLVGPDGAEERVRPATATDRGADLPPADLVIFAVKGQDLDGAMEEAAPAMAGGAPALPFLNGVEATDRLAARFGADRALIGIARISSLIAAPGTIRQVTSSASYTIGEADGRQDGDRVPAIRAAFAEAGVRVPDSADVRADLWAKFVMFAALSGVTAGARCDVATIRATPELGALHARLAAETERLARARGIDLSADMAGRVAQGLATLPGEMRASTAHDLAAGKPLEVDWLAGAVARLAAAEGLEAPANATVAALLAPWRAGTQG